MKIAITREVSPSIVNCELTHLERQPIDVDLAIEQHAAYEAALAELGCTVRRLDAEPDLPDSVFVEDTALVLDEVALILRSGAPSRRPEAASVAAARRVSRTAQAVAGELDVVVPSGWLRAGELARALDALAPIVARGRVPVQGMVEAAVFDAAALARIAREVVAPSGASFFKTGTGVYGGAFTPERIGTLRSALPEGLRLKVSGGIRGAGAARAALESGADVLGTSRTFAILGLE